ncbi:MAG: alanine racemase [Burkholderiales bacterium]
MARPIRARIDLAALHHNLSVVRRAAPEAKIFAVVKAGAYGHGLLRAAQALANAEGFALLEIDSAVRLREAGFRNRIVLLEGVFEAAELATADALGLAVVVHSLPQLAMLETFRAGVPLDVFFKINTGMNRLGFDVAAAPGALARLRRCASVGQITLMSHFAEADDARGVAWQMERFWAAVGDSALPKSLANSAAVLRYPTTHFDWVRPGIMLYGSSPFPETSASSLGLKPVMTLMSELIAVQNLSAGERVGYGGTFTAYQPARIGVVACGYADGYPRHAPTGTPIVVGGRHATVVGRVAMDMLYADITHLPEAGIGTPVTLWGEGCPIDEVAKAAGTVGYELMCALSLRVPILEHHG